MKLFLLQHRPSEETRVSPALGTVPITKQKLQPNPGVSSSHFSISSTVPKHVKTWPNQSDYQLSDSAPISRVIRSRTFHLQVSVSSSVKWRLVMALVSWHRQEHSVSWQCGTVCRMVCHHHNHHVSFSVTTSSLTLDHGRRVDRCLTQHKAQDRNQEVVCGCSFLQLFCLKNDIIRW